MGVREIDRSLENWGLGVKDVQRRVILETWPETGFSRVVSYTWGIKK